MAKKKSKSFGKHIYALVAIVVLLVAAGIASYAASVPSGSPTHAVLYVNTIFGKGIGTIDVNDTLKINKRMEALAGAGDDNAIVARHSSSQMAGALGYLQAGVWGISLTTMNEGKLGTATAGVEGTATGINYAGKFEGGNGLFASKIEFGVDAFDASDGTGLLIVGSTGDYNCNEACSSHRLGCYAAYLLNGNPTTCLYDLQARYCWCGRS